MADINKAPNPLYLRDEELRQSMELLFYAYRGFTAQADTLLDQHSFGRAHHRVIYFVGRYPSISVTELLGILRITKQSLSRVLRQLVAEGFITQRPGTRDRRQRLLALTEQGIELERRLSTDQRERIAAAYRESGPQAVEGYRKVLFAMIDPRDRARLLGADRAKSAAE
jgi:DNA-binding MarR family transcriptional regulator